MSAAFEFVFDEIGFADGVDKKLFAQLFQIRQILQDRHTQALAKKAQEAAQAQKLAYLAKRPTYQNSRQRQRAAMDQFCMGVMSWRWLKHHQQILRT